MSLRHLASPSWSEGRRCLSGCITQNSLRVTEIGSSWCDVRCIEPFFASCADGIVGARLADPVQDVLLPPALRIWVARQRRIQVQGKESIAIGLGMVPENGSKVRATISDLAALATIPEPEPKCIESTITIWWDIDDNADRFEEFQIGYHAGMTCANSHFLSKSRDLKKPAPFVPAFLPVIPIPRFAQSPPQAAVRSELRQFGARTRGTTGTATYCPRKQRSLPLQLQCDRYRYVCAPSSCRGS